MNISKLQKAKKETKQRRANRVRSRVSGTAERPRLSVHRSLKHLSAQLIDDEAGQTLLGMNDKAFKGTKTEKALALGKALAEAAKGKKISAVGFDRSSYRYHGRVKALADGARAGGLQF